MKENNICQKLNYIQTTLKCNKGQYNKFGKYSYRSCEDVLESVKPLLKETETALILQDSVELIGDRYYVKATATLVDIHDSKSLIANQAYAREEETKKGMDGSQLTGTASSYARKYALNGLFAIDDTKDADTDEYHEQTEVKITKEDIEKIQGLLSEERLKNMLNYYKIKDIKELSDKTAKELIVRLTNG